MNEEKHSDEFFELLKQKSNEKGLGEELTVIRRE